MWFLKIWYLLLFNFRDFVKNFISSTKFFDLLNFEIIMNKIEKKTFDYFLKMFFFCVSFFAKKRFVLIFLFDDSFFDECQKWIVFEIFDVSNVICEKLIDVFERELFRRDYEINWIDVRRNLFERENEYWFVNKNWNELLRWIVLNFWICVDVRIICVVEKKRFRVVLIFRRCTIHRVIVYNEFCRIVVCCKYECTIHRVVIVVVCRLRRTYHRVVDLTILKIKIDFHFSSFVENIRENFDWFCDDNCFARFENDCRRIVFKIFRVVDWKILRSFFFKIRVNENFFHRDQNFDVNFFFHVFERIDVHDCDDCWKWWWWCHNFLKIIWNEKN